MVFGWGESAWTLDESDTAVQGRPTLGAHPTTGDVARAALAAAVDRFTQYDDPASFSRDPESVHQARVGLRRVRSYARTFRPVLEAKWAMDLRAEAAWYAQGLGLVRDLDVQLQRLVEDSATTGIDPEDARPLLELLGEEREKALRALEESSKGARHERLVLRLGDAFDPPLRKRAGRPATKGCPPLLVRSWRDFKDCAARARSSPTDANIHALRIQSKRLRYTADATAPALGHRVDKLAAAAGKLQDKLGDLHDTVVLLAWLEERGRSVPGCAFSAGKLWGTEKRIAEASRTDWLEELNAVRRRWRRWRH